MHYRYVLMQFRESVSAAEIQEVERRQRGFEAIDAVEWVREGLRVTPTPRLPYTHAVLVGFADSRAMEAYVRHPIHREAQAAIHPLMEDFLIIDNQDPPTGSRLIGGEDRT
jgi:hypothetical protein